MPAIRFTTNDSTVSGVTNTTDTVVATQPGGVKSNDLLIMSIGLHNGGTNPTLTTPTGWTQLTTTSTVDLRTYVYHRRALADDETYPDVVASANIEWTVVTMTVNGAGVDYANGPIGASAAVQSTNDDNQDSPDITTDHDDAILISIKYMEDRTEDTATYFDAENSRDTCRQAFTSGATGTGDDDGRQWIAIDYEATGSTLVDMANWINPSSDSTAAVSFEIVTDGTIKPLLLDQYPFTDIDPSTYTIGTSESWIDAIVDSGELIDGTTGATWDFDASTDVNTSGDRINIPSHGMDESMVVRLNGRGNTPPSGLNDQGRYFVRVSDADWIQLVPATGDIDSSGEWFVNGTTFKSIVDITATGSGTMTLEECRMLLNYGFEGGVRPPNGSSSNDGANSGDWIGDAGQNQNWPGWAITFNTSRDMSSEIMGTLITTKLRYTAEERIIFIDTDNDWISFNLFEKGDDEVTDLFSQFEVGDAGVQALADHESGTFNAAAVKHIVRCYRADNSTIARGDTDQMGMTAPRVSRPITVIGGGTNNVIDLLDISEVLDSIDPSISDAPSDIQFVFIQPLHLGNGTDDIVFSDSEKSIAFPPLADGVTKKANYIASLGIEVDATANSDVTLRNSQIGASAPFDFDILANASATLDLDGNTLILADVTLDADQALTRQLFVGGPGVVHNDAEIRNSTFIVGSDVGADSGMITWGSTTDIEGTTFELGSDVTTGHAIIITSPGTYTFTDLTFTGFGATGSVTAAVYNNSGGAVTINVTGGTSPTYRNGASATTTVSTSVPVTVTVIRADDATPIENARVRLEEDPGGTAVLTGLTNASGVLSGTFSGSTPQDVIGRVRKSSTSPYFKTGDIVGTIDSSGFSVTIAMVLDE